MAGNKNSGGRPVPLKVLELEGKRPHHARSAMVAPVGRPEKPTDLDDSAAEHWDFICRVRPDWVDVADGASLRALCEAWSGSRAAWLAMQAIEDGLLDRNLQQTYLAYVKQWQSLAGLFGLTPADRARYVSQSQQTDRQKSEQYLA